MTVSPYRLSTATHEAGHAAVGRRLGLRIESATIRETLHAVGRVVWDTASAAPEAVIVATLAGPIAARRFPNPDRGTDNDHAVARVIAERVWPGNADAQLERLRRRAVGEVDAAYREITLIAEALVERDTLTGAEIERLLKNS